LRENSFWSEANPNLPTRYTLLWQADARELIARTGLWIAKTTVEKYDSKGYKLPSEFMDAIKEKQKWVESGMRPDKDSSSLDALNKIKVLIYEDHTKSVVNQNLSDIQLEYKYNEARLWRTIESALGHETYHLFLTGWDGPDIIDEKAMGKELERQVKQLKAKTLESQITL
jgi:hypothetical protein